MIVHLFAMLLVVILGLGLGVPAYAHGADDAGASRSIASPAAQPSSAGRHVTAGTTQVVVDLASAVVGPAFGPAFGLGAPTFLDDHCHCDGGVCSTAAPLPPSAGRTARQPRDGGPPLADQVAALNVVDPLLQPPQR